MNFFKRLAMAYKATDETTWRFNDPSWYARNGYASILGALGGGGGGTAAGITVNVPLAMQCGAAYVCSRAICESMATMPLQLLRTDGSSTVKAKKSPLYEVLARRPNNYQTAKVFWRTIFHHALNYGNGYARIVRIMGKRDEPVIALHIMHPSSVEKINDGGMDPVFRWTKPDGKQEVLGNDQVFHLMNYSDDGITGIGAVYSGRETIALALAIEKFGSAFFARGGVPAGMIVKDIPFKDDTSRQQFKSDWAKEYEGFGGFFKKLLVEGGSWKFDRFGLSPADSQLNDAAMSIVPAVARFYGITPHLAGDLSRATFSNIEHLWIEFLQITLMPWVVAVEQEVERVLLSTAERAGGFYAKFNTSSFQRGDFQTRMAAYATLLQNGVTSINQIRKLEDWDEIEGGDSHHIQLNMQTVPGSGEPTTSERAQLIKISDGAKPKPAEKQIGDITVTVDSSAKSVTKRIIRDEDGRIAGIEEVV